MKNIQSIAIFLILFLLLGFGFNFKMNEFRDQTVLDYNQQKIEWNKQSKLYAVGFLDGRKDVLDSLNAK
tara:strand:+ start:9129 stop:9335 length:207 start_codon:yes stop_codon:yes gene_type:complete